MFDSKPVFQRHRRPAARAGMTANQETGATIALSCTGGAVILAHPGALWLLWLVPAALLVGLTFNHIDAMLACEQGMNTSLGGMLNELADVVADPALYLQLATVPGVMLGLVDETLLEDDRTRDGAVVEAIESAFRYLSDLVGVSESRRVFAIAPTIGIRG
ncbi:MAG: CDP-alcohol phosphatidyltransferase family protein [Alphaproteobacteria bacterium]